MRLVSKNSASDTMLNSKIRTLAVFLTWELLSDVDDNDKNNDAQQSPNVQRGARIDCASKIDWGCQQTMSCILLVSKKEDRREM